MIRLFPGTVPVRGDGADLEPHERARLRTAAPHARRVYPGDLGELASARAHRPRRSAMRFEPDALIPWLARAILAMPTVTADAELSR